jgi:glycosyltransferase involved in cell wall biosynthesis
MNTFEGIDLICFSHLRWNFVYQRPQHLMSRFAKNNRVFFFEEPFFDDVVHYDVTKYGENLHVITPHLARGMGERDAVSHQQEFLSRFLIKMNIQRYACWYYTPMALLFSDHLQPFLTVYDCMDELSAFKFAPKALKDLERRLMSQSDIVFTGGHGLYDAKKNQHRNIHSIPSSIDFDHFFKARTITEEPADQEQIPHPRFGFYGVIDERMNLELLGEVAARKKDWHFILIGPVVKINDEELPRGENIHYLGMKNYDDLPKYLAGWDVAIMPFALNESTHYISPTKTPEYLAGGKPVISTPIIDVKRQYSGLVNFAATADDFISVAEKEIQRDERWLSRVDAMLAENSWDKTWLRMSELIKLTLTGEASLHLKNNKEYV